MLSLKLLCQFERRLSDRTRQTWFCVFCLHCRSATGNFFMMSATVPWHHPVWAFTSSEWLSHTADAEDLERQLSLEGEGKAGRRSGAPGVRAKRRPPK